MGARLLLHERRVVSEAAFVEMIVWHVSTPLHKSRHRFKYRLAYVVNDSCVIRYDNEAGKGDHKHFGEHEVPYTFTTPEVLINDFWADVEKWRP